MTSIAEQLIPWQKKCGRHDLPWQKEPDPYTVWLSEIMLQQTQVITVIPYYQRFIQKFPHIKNLAQASTDEVMSYWSGLGYYSRARNLHRAAGIIMREYRGNFPQTHEAIQQLPGIGRSTAAAIMVFAYGKRAAILDGNVKRVFARYFGIKQYPGESAALKQLWRLAETALPESNTADSIRTYTQALMDLGSTVCQRRKPLCNQCPLQQGCVALINNQVAQLPVSKPVKQLPVRETVFMIYRNNNKVLLKKRPEKGIWGGLWCFPESEMNTQKKSIVQQTQMVMLPQLRHTFTHFKLSIHPCLHDVYIKTTASADMIWVNPKQALQMAIPVPVKKLIQLHLMS